MYNTDVIFLEANFGVVIWGLSLITILDYNFNIEIICFVCLNFFRTLSNFSNYCLWRFQLVGWEGSKWLRQNGYLFQIVRHVLSRNELRDDGERSQIP